ncbi:MAG: AAA family ATPase [Lachnospiraceae bacterium]|nr:AAA family ATPase [Lachnospiraceae bacterium]
MYRAYDVHKDNTLPFVRIKRLELTNFKGVQHGILEFNCAKEFVPYDTKSDILGLYGQNGSGKTSVVEAIRTLKGIFMGYKMSSLVTNAIDVNAECAVLNIEFDFQYRDGRVATVSYETKIKVIEEEKKELNAIDNGEKVKIPQIYDEIVKTNIYADKSIGRMHTIIDTTTGKLLCSDSLEEYYFNNKDKETVRELEYLKRKLMDDSYSFIFSEAVSETFNVKNLNGSASAYYEILSELQLYATSYLCIIETGASGMVQLKAGIPFYLPDNGLVLFDDKTILPEKSCEIVEQAINSINGVINTIIPSFELVLYKTKTITEKGEEAYLLKLMSKREEKIFPLKYEADGIIKIVSVLAVFTWAFYQGSTTLVVDEFDSGVFEYLLGELLQIFESAGRGQFIFTSHNLRPLEVINKKFIRFTTSDPNDRYCKLKNIGATNNLRDLYLREVQMKNMDVELYKKTKSYKIARAMQKAGEEMDPSGK